MKKYLFLKKIEFLVRTFLYWLTLFVAFVYGLGRGIFLRTYWLSGRAIKTNLKLGVYYVYGSEVDGDIAEFGTMSGQTALAIATSMSETEWVTRIPPKKLYLFDSFEGLPQSGSPIDKDSPHVLSGIWSQGTCRGLTKEQLFRLCSTQLPAHRIEIYAGYFCDTLVKLPNNTRFAMLHIDSDLYQSAMDVLDVCFSKNFIVPGGMIFFDDWNCNRGSPNFGERKAWAEVVEKYSVIFSDEGAYGVFGHKFIIHAYKCST